MVKKHEILPGDDVLPAKYRYCFDGYRTDNYPKQDDLFKVQVTMTFAPIFDVNSY